jgi:heme exporter protein A
MGCAVRGREFPAMMTVRASGVSKQFNRRNIFRDVSFDVQPGEVFGITGRNGSGKSTLLKIVAGVLSPSAGKVEYTLEGKAVDPEQVYRHIGFASPYLTLFEEFSARENIELFARIRSLRIDRTRTLALLERVGLPTDRDDPIRSYSSGMKQRMKLIFAILHEPPVLLLDEPVSNLDTDGMDIVYSVVEEHRRRGPVIIATNDASDIARCDRTCHVGPA